MKKNNKKGFTLVELVIVVAVMAILVAVAIPTVGAVTKSAKVSVYNSNAKTIESMIKLAEADADQGQDTVTLTKDQIEKALNDAKLGIKQSGSDTTYSTFYFIAETGSVSIIEKSGTTYTGPAVASKAGDIKIEFGTNGKATATITAGTAGG